MGQRFGMSGRRAAAGLAAGLLAWGALSVALPPLAFAQTAGVAGLPAPSVAPEAAPNVAPVLAPQTTAQAATLVADSVTLSGGRSLIAEGNVEIYYQGNRLTATRIIYDGTTDQMRIIGPIRIVEASGSAVILASSAQMSRDLQDGILQGARLVLARELQLAAQSIERQSGRYTVMDRVVASSCQVCATNPTPLWEIRARRVTHDAQTRTLEFEGAQFRAMGVPIAYLPHLTTPDPTVDRMSGFLTPRLSTSSLLGTGLSLPYFITLGDSRDVTLTPSASNQGSYSLGLRYREAYSRGAMIWAGAITRDRTQAGKTRGYLFADGTFSLPRGYRIGMQLRAVSDKAYPVDYDVTDEDRLWSGITVERVRADRMVWGRVGTTYSIREGETNGTQPALAGDAQSTRTYVLGGGIAHLDWEVHAHRRSSKVDGDLGRDVARLGIEAGYSRNWLISGGILATVTGLLNADIYRITSDSAYPDVTGRLAPTVALTLRMPFVRQTGSAAEAIEPVAQIVWSRGALNPVPNEDSLLVEFDEGNLFALSRYPGEDARERGLRANLGLSWTRQDAAGWSLGLTAGRVFKARDLAQFGDSTGLTGMRSDWLLASHLTTKSGLILSNRALIDDRLALARDELRLGYAADDTAVSLGYLWIEADAVESRAAAISELMLDTAFPLHGNWTGSLDTRYDLTAARAAKAALGLQYTNECVTVDLSLSRRFTSSTSVSPETRAGLSVQLAGFGTSEKRGTARCTR